jgi:predicted Rossmann-fold nucleotide-binding protein
MIAGSEEEKPQLLAGCKTAMQQIRRVCVYCGSSGAVDERYREADSELGSRLAAAGMGLYFGGGRGSG